MPRITATLNTNIDVPLAGPGSPCIELCLQVAITAERGDAAGIGDVHLCQLDWNSLARQYDETIRPFPADDWSQGLRARAIKALYASKTFKLDAADALEEAYHGQRNAGLEMKAELRRENRAAAE